jgi:uncharacterized short protein YbdD (DUF466 family)
VRATLHWLGRAGAIVRRVIGAPDYERYLAHMRARHPECAPLSREQFITAQLSAKYERPGSRCC